MNCSYHIALLAALCSSACSFNGDSRSFADDGGGDAPTVDIDADRIRPDADPRAPGHLLLSEVKTTVSGTEFIEIYNPGPMPVPLANYYLADNANYPLLPSVFSIGLKPSLENSDFIVRFPDGAMIAPGQALVVGVNAGDLVPAADFRIGKGTSAAMDPAYPSSIGSQSSLTDNGEGIALFFWDGMSDLVVDIDLLNAGSDIDEGNLLPNKTGLSVDGPDLDLEPSTYAPDAFTMGQFVTQTQEKQSYTRISAETGVELHEGSGNGQNGHDETSEAVSTTWTIAELASPGVVSGSF